eukprot:358192-Chlamydomonas_euryale.AAC.17
MRVWRLSPRSRGLQHGATPQDAPTSQPRPAALWGRGRSHYYSVARTPHHVLCLVATRCDGEFALHLFKPEHAAVRQTPAANRWRATVGDSDIVPRDRNKPV